MNLQFIDLKEQQTLIRREIDQAISRVLDHGRYIMGPEVAQLEGRLSEYVGVKHAVACSSGTDALLLSLLAYGIGPGDAIFTTPFTFFASCEVIALTGATPVFVDIEESGFNIDVCKLERTIADVFAEGKLTPKGIIPVDLFGLPADYDAIMPIAQQFDLFVLEDAAQAFGAQYKGRRAPGLGNIGATSFFPAKPLGCYGDGGAVFTDDDELASIIRSLLVHGKGDDKYDNVQIGLNARMDTMQAAILIEKLKIFPKEVDMRQAVAERYNHQLDSFSLKPKQIITPEVNENCQSVWAQYTIRSSARDSLQQRLGEAGIPTMIYYKKPMHLLEAMSNLGNNKGDFANAEQASKSVLSLPFHPYLELEDQARIVDTIVLSLSEIN